MGSVGDACICSTQSRNLKNVLHILKIQKLHAKLKAAKHSAQSRDCVISTQNLENVPKPVAYMNKNCIVQEHEW